MNRKIIAIHDPGGQYYVDYAQAECARRGYEQVAMDIGTALSDDTVLDEYALISLTMGHNGEVYREYALMLRSKTSTPIVFFPYGDGDAAKNAASGVYEGATQMIALPTVLDWVIANCHALIRERPSRSAAGNDEPTIYADYKFVLEENGYRAFVDDHLVELSEIEFKLLRLLMDHRGIFLVPDEIIPKVWGTSPKFVSAHVLHNQVLRLRKKLQWNDGLPQYIETGHRKGYRFWPHYPNLAKA